MKVKICGITRLEDALCCEKYGADAIGYIFFKGSKRYISPENAGEISSRLSPFILKTGVFVNEPADEINRIAKIAGLNAVQLSGDETLELAEEINLPVIKGFRVKDDFNFAVLNNYKNCGFLLDSFNEKEYGGTGKTFNWENIPAGMRGKIILAGGISAENIDLIINEIKPAAVDISSSVETAPGIKDENKIKIFMNKINSYRINL